MGGEGVYIDKELVFNQNGYIIVEYINNHEYAKKIFPSTLNTIRLLTAVLDNKIIVLSAVHRFGTLSTSKVDNFTSGGISCKIDLDNGELINAIQFKNNKKYILSKHPDTNSNIIGEKIPNWREVLNEVTQLHDKINFIKYIGWDIAITSKSFEIIEANHVSDLDLIQCHNTLLNEKENRRFYDSIFK